MGWLADQVGIRLACRAPWQFGVETGRRTLLEHFGTRTLEGFDFSDMAIVWNNGAVPLPNDVVFPNVEYISEHLFEIQGIQDFQNKF